MTKLRKTAFVFVVLHPDSIDIHNSPVELRELDHLTDVGGAIGQLSLMGSSVILSKRTAVKELQELGDDGTFFELDDLSFPLSEEIDPF